MLLRFVVVLAGAVAFGASGAAQATSASAASGGFADRAAGPFGEDPSPSEPSGHRPTSGTTSVLVTLNSNLNNDQVQKLVANLGGAERASMARLRLVVVDVPTAQAQAIRGRYLKDARVKSVELDHVRKAAASPSDPLYPNQWNLTQIGWQQVYGSVLPVGTATIAVLDTGVDATHPDLEFCRVIQPSRALTRRPTRTDTAPRWRVSRSQRLTTRKESPGSLTPASRFCPCRYSTRLVSGRTATSSVALFGPRTTAPT